MDSKPVRRVLHKRNAAGGLRGFPGPVFGPDNAKRERWAAMAQGFSSHEIYEILRDEIMYLTIKPGDTLRENALCDRFGVSRTPIRTVLQELRINGLVEVTPYKYTRVTQLNLDAITQQIYLRVAVEGAVISDYCAVCTPDQIAALRARNEAMRRAADSGSVTPEQFYQMDSRLHECWFNTMHKEHLWQIIQNAQNHYSRFRVLDLVEQNFGDIVAEHEVLLDALARQDAPAARELIHGHLYGGIARLSSDLPTKFASYFVPGTVWPEAGANSAK